MKEYFILREVSNGFIIQRECDGEDIERVETSSDDVVDFVMELTLKMLHEKKTISITIEHGTALS